MKQINSIIVLAILATSCATKPYIHASITDPTQLKKQMAIDDGECTRQAASATPSRQSIYIEDSRGRGNGFAKGFNAGGGNDPQSDRSFKKIYNGCMVSRGWDKAE